MDLNEGNESFNDLSKHAQEEIKKTIDRDKLLAEIENDLKTNPKYKSFFEKYHPSSIDSFITSYKYKKSMWIEYGEIYTQIEQDTVLKYSEIAYERLWDIQQKKLFDLQCQWRAESIKLPGVEITDDFRIWEHLITECPFLSPISESEYELYRDFILSPGFEVYPLFNEDWQDYDRYKEEHYSDNDDISLPEWYQFYDSRMGTGTLLGLPDVRGKKEEFYSNLYHKNDKKKNPEEYNFKPNPDTRPPLYSLEEKAIEEFVNTYEEPKIKEYYRIMENRYEDIDHDDDLREAIEILRQAGSIELEYAGTWRESILTTAKNYEIRCVYNAFASVYKNYLNRLKTGIGFETKKDEELVKIIETGIGNIKKHILRGRVLNNEPEDFNF